MIKINRKAYRANELNEKYEIQKADKKSFWREEGVSKTQNWRLKSLGLSGPLRLLTGKVGNSKKD